MEILDWSQLDRTQRWEALARPRLRSDKSLRGNVHGIVDDVRKRGWAGLCAQSLRLDQCLPERLAVAPFAEAARRLLSPEQLAAFGQACRMIRLFHDAIRPQDVAVETLPGLLVHKVWRPIERVGLYVPGGPPSLFSTLLMLAIPARAAAVPEVVVATPPRRDCTLEPVLALAAEQCGITHIWTMGGAQAIAALAFGAGEIAPAAKICGPGNAYVNAAKTYVTALPDGPAIDLPAGPSELMVIADGTADPRLVAADLLSQAEHDPSAQVLLVTTASTIAAAVTRELEAQLADLPRGGLVRSALKCAKALIVASAAEAIAIANAYAPEHLSLAIADAASVVAEIRNAGAVFVGQQAAETFGDYLAGSSHVLPTDGAAKAWSGVSVQTFMKSISVQEMTADAARALAGPAAILARMEGLEAHARAADLRCERVEP